jgi:RNA polymerase sigma-70 factor, ECF subfamily
LRHTAPLRVIDDDRTDAVLLSAAAQHGDGDAFGRLVRRYIRAATLLATQLVGDHDDAEDVVQDAFTLVYRQANAFDGARPFAPWFYAIVRRLAANRMAKAARRRRLLRLWGARDDVELTSTRDIGAMDARVDADAARRAMAALSPMQRACFELVVIRDLSIPDVAAMHGISESTVRQHVFRARAALRHVLDGSEPRQRES